MLIDFSVLQYFIAPSNSILTVGKLIIIKIQRIPEVQLNHVKTMDNLINEVRIIKSRSNITHTNLLDPTSGIFPKLASHYNF